MSKQKYEEKKRSTKKKEKETKRTKKKKKFDADITKKNIYLRLSNETRTKVPIQLPCTRCGVERRTIFYIEDKFLICTSCAVEYKNKRNKINAFDNVIAGKKITLRSPDKTKFKNKNKLVKCARCGTKNYRNIMYKTNGKSICNPCGIEFRKNKEE